MRARIARRAGYGKEWPAERRGRPQGLRPARPEAVAPGSGLRTRLPCVSGLRQDRPCPGAPHRIEPPVRAELFDDPEHARRDRILRSIPGVGPVTAAILCAEMPELGTLGRRQAASLMGYSSLPRRQVGVRYCKGGRAVPRNSLFMAAMTASMYNAEMKQLYERLTEKGKPHKVAVVAVMRKLIILANVLVRDDREWAPSAPAPIGG